MIDFDLVLVMEPLTITGAVIGSILNKVSRDISTSSLIGAMVVALGHTRDSDHLPPCRHTGFDCQENMGQGLQNLRKGALATVSLFSQRTGLKC